MDLEAVLDFITGDNAYILHAFLIDFFQKRVINRIHERALKSNNFWDDVLIDSVRKPLRLVIWTVGIYMASEVIHQSAESVIFEAMGPLRDTLIIVAIAWFVIRLVTNGEEVFLKKDEKLDRTTADAIAKLLKLSVVITSFLVVLQTLGFSTWRVFRLVLAESVVMSAIGGAVGLGLAALALSQFQLSVGAEAVTIAFEPTVAMAMTSGAAALLVGLVSGLFPAWHAARADIVSALRHAG